MTATILSANWNRMGNIGVFPAALEIILQAIMEETLASGEYVPLFLISILNMNIWKLKNYMTASVFLKK